MSIGIGLGAFVDGFAKGQQIRQGWDAAKERKDAQQRETTNRQALEKIETDTQAQFNASVESGAAKPDQFDSFWKDYALPRRKMEMLRQGDIAGARQLEEWGQSDAALKGGRLFSSAMLKAQTGDAGGALADVIKAGQVAGYIEHGYELEGQDEIQDADGNTVGYRLKVKTGEGKSIEQDIAVGDIPQMISTFANPDAAWASQLEARKAAAKKDEERAEKSSDRAIGLEDYETKKQIDQRYEKPKAPEAGKQAEIYRKAREDRVKNDLEFGDLSAEEQDRIIREDLAASDRYEAERAPQPAPESMPGLGGAVAPAPAAQAAPPAAAPQKMIVDQVTGKPVPMSQPQQQAPAPGMAPAAAQAPSGPSRQQIVAEAAAYIAKGGDPQQVSRQLKQAGISEDEWAPEIRTALQRQPAGQPGLAQ